MAVSYTSGSLAMNTTDKYDFKDMIAKLRKIEEIPARKLLKWKADWELRVAGFKDLKESLVTLRDSLSKINSVDKFLVKSASSSNETVVKATAAAGAQVGDYSIEVNQLARNAISAFSSAGLDSKTMVLNNTSSDQVFAYTYAGQSRSITVAPGTTLTGLVNMINDSPDNPGVRATLIQDGNRYSFQLRGMDLGANNTLTIDPATNVSSSGSITPGNGAKSVVAPTASSAAFYFGGAIAGGSILNGSADPQSFTINYKGINTTVNLAAGGTLNDLVTLINGVAGASGVTASLGLSAGNVVLNLAGDVSGTSAGPITITSDIANAAESVDLSSGWTSVPGVDSSITYSSSAFTDSAGGAVVNSSGGDQNFQYFVNGAAQNVSVPNNTTLSGLAALINASALANGLTDVSASISASGPPYNLVIDGGGTPLAFSNATGAIDFGDTSLWASQAPTNAQYRVNGWPASGYLESTSNTVDDVIEGVTLNFRSTGESEVVIGVDTEAIKKNIDDFLLAYNTFKATYASLTKVDATKKTYDPEYTDSLFDMQQGGVLTGNYVVQLIGSQLGQIIGGAGLGFINQTNTSPGASNFYDPFSTLASIGIVTDSDKESSTFGLLIYDSKMDLYGGKSALEVALDNNPTAVAELFAANNLGKTNSSNFSFSTSLSKITQPGEYSVSYDIDGSGQIINAFIDGKAASVSGNDITATDSASGSRGLTITVNNLVPGSYSGDSVFIKQGKANELYSALSLNDSRSDPVTGEMVDFKGAIKRMDDLIAQYTGGSGGDAKNQGIIKNIEDKIDKENQRLEVWERFMVQKFARLEAILGTYEQLEAQLKSQINNLSSGSSS